MKKIRVVGTVHCARGWRAAARPPSGVDLLEIRVDALPWPVSPGELARLAARGLPLLVTVRDFAEGGARPLPHELRHQLYQELLPYAWGIDIEAANLDRFSDLVAAAGSAGKTIVASFHDFDGLPSRRKLAGIARTARERGADIVKVAAHVSDRRALAAFLAAADALGEPFAAMGMGPLGKVSRLAFAAAGSILNYGWLGSPQVPGQLSAKALAGMLRGLLDQQ